MEKRPAKRVLVLLGLSSLLIATGCQQAVMGMTISLPPTPSTTDTSLPIFPTLEPEYSPSAASPQLEKPIVPTMTLKPSAVVTTSKSNAPGGWTSPPLPTTYTTSQPPLPTTSPPPGLAVPTSGPAQVTGLTASPNGTDGIKLSWQRVQADNILCYVVYRSTTSGGPYTPIAYPGAIDTNYNNSPLEFGTAYYYCVSAVDVHNQEGQLSTEVSAVNFSQMSVPVVVEVFSREN